MKDFAQNCQTCGVEHTSSKLAAIKISGYAKKLKVCASCMVLAKVDETYREAAELIVYAFENNSDNV